jgi:hypothetical protein
MAQQALLDAAIVFCEDSQAVRSSLDTVYLVAGVAQYELDPPTAQAIATVLDVVIDGERLRSVYFDEVASLKPQKGKPTSYYTSRDGGAVVLHLYPTPDQRYTAAVTVAARPTRSATVFDDDLVDFWADAVLSGAIGRLCAIPGQPFTSVELAVAAGSAAVSKSRDARRTASSGQIRGSMAVKGRPFA